MKKALKLVPKEPCLSLKLSGVFFLKLFPTVYLKKKILL